MANRNQLMSIPLNGQLCLNKTKVDIEQFNGFNKINAPIYGGCLSPLYKKEVTPKGDYWDTDGNYYQAKADGLYKNGELVMEYETEDFEIIEIKKTSLMSEAEELLAYRNDVYVTKKDLGHNYQCLFYYKNSRYFAGPTVSYDSIITDVYINENLIFITEKSFENSVEELKIHITELFLRDQTPSFNTTNISIPVPDKYKGTPYSPFILAHRNNSLLNICYATLYFEELENKDFNNTIQTAFHKNLYIKYGYGNTIDADLITSIQYDSYDLAVVPSSFVESGMICFIPNTVSNKTKLLYPPVLVGNNTLNFNTTNKSLYVNLSDVNSDEFYVKHNASDTKIKNVTITINRNFFRILVTDKIDASNVTTVCIDPKSVYFLHGLNSGRYVEVGGGYTVNGENINTSPSVCKKDIVSILINNNYVSNISYKNKIIIDWFSVDNSYFIGIDTVNDMKRICYKDSASKKIYEINVVSSNVKIINVIDNRYIITNTSKNYCYDIKTGKSFFPFNDYNGVFFLTYTGAETFNFKNVFIGCAVNPKYESSESNISSAIFPALTYYNSDPDRICIYYNNAELYQSIITENTVAIYKQSFKFLMNNNDKHISSFIDRTIEGLSYPVSTNGSMQLNMNANSKYVQTYNNHDFVINGSTSYALNYYNGEVVLLYSMLSAIENLQNVFVLNTSAYGISKDKIFAMYYSDGVSTLGEVVANIKGLQYVGALPTRAIFYNPLDRCLYCFTGDAILSKYIECSDVSAVYNSWYNASSQTILFSSNAGLYVMSNDFIYNLDFRPENIFFLDGGKFVMNLNNDSEKSIFFAYEKLDSGYTTLNIQLETKYYGEGRNLPGVVDCWYIRFFNNGIKEGGTIKVRASALTDTGKVGEEKEIALLPSSWDKETDSYYLRFQPHLQKGIGVCLELDSPFAILDITCGYSGFDGAAQISHNNL